MYSTRIIDNLYIGSCPQTTKAIDSLRYTGVTAIVNFQTEEDEANVNIDWPALSVRYDSHGIKVRRIPVRDFDAEDLAKKLPQCVRTLAELLDAGNTVYIHCTAGMGRSPTVAIAYLYWHGGMTLDQAYDHVRSRRACAPTLKRSAMPPPPDDIGYKLQKTE